MVSDPDPKLTAALAKFATADQRQAQLARISDAERRMIFVETDVRFWAQTGYKVGRKLDPTNLADAAMMGTYNDVLQRVIAEHDVHGFVTPTHLSPSVQVPLANAAVANAASEQHAAASVDAAAAGDAAAAAHHADQAAQAGAEARAQARQAARAQPVSVRPAAVAADADAAKAAKKPVLSVTVTKTPIPTPGLSPATAMPTPVLPGTPAVVPHLSDADRARAKQALIDVMGAEHAATHAAGVQAQGEALNVAQGRAPDASPATTGPPARDARDPDATPEVDDAGRVKQPSSSRPWIAAAIGAACLGAILAAGQLNKARSSRSGGSNSKPSARGSRANKGRTNRIVLI